MFESLTASLSSAINSLRGRGRLTEANIREGLAAVRTALTALSGTWRLRKTNPSTYATNSSSHPTPDFLPNPELTRDLRAPAVRPMAALDQRLAGLELALEGALPLAPRPLVEDRKGLRERRSAGTDSDNRSDADLSNAVAMSLA